MQVVNLLTFLNSVKELRVPEFSKCDRDLVDLLSIIDKDEQFTQYIDLGIIFINPKSMDKYEVVDGANRLVSLSLLLHAVCECYKKTTEKNAKAIQTIRSKYLTIRNKTKLQLSDEDSELYSKIINGERLSGHEKSKPIFKLLHKFWLEIKERKLQASNIFKMLQKVQVTLVETEGVNSREIYNSINSQIRSLNQIVLIDDYIKEQNLLNEWEEIKNKYFVEKDDITLFLQDFLVTKFNYVNFDITHLYEYFKNYFETMLQYQKKKVLIDNISRSAMLYYNILNINFEDEKIRHAFINIKKHAGEDTYAYILNVYEDYYRDNITESIFLEILNTIDEYLKNRMNSGKNIDFNELINYLNAFIACK